MIEQTVSLTVKSRRQKPAEVRLKRVTCEYGTVHSPDGQENDWWRSLQEALGTVSGPFVSASLAHLQAAARLPDGPVSETGMNAAIAMIQAAGPRNALESAIALQAACCHISAMNVLARVGSGHGGERHVTAYAKAASALMRAFAVNVETLRRLHHGSAQVVRVEHVHINDGGQAVIGNIGTPETDREAPSVII